MCGSGFTSRDRKTDLTTFTESRYAKKTGLRGPEAITNEFDIFMNIYGILNMTRNSSRTTHGRVSDFRFNPTKWPGTSTFDVYRDGAGVWTVTADGADIAALVQIVRGKEKSLGQYYMPFQITVVCPTCS